MKKKDVVILVLNETGKLDETGTRNNLNFHLIICKRMHLFRKCLLSTFSAPDSVKRKWDNNKQDSYNSYLCGI